MSRYTDNAPIGNTCGMIDNIIGRMEQARNEAEYINNHPEEDSSGEAVSILDELYFAIKEMEDIRNANSELREWGNEQHDRADEAENERDDLLLEKERLEDRVDTLEAELNEVSV